MSNGGTVRFVDTSVLVELISVPGMCSADRQKRLKPELSTYLKQQDTLVLPITALIETGNHIAQCSGDRHEAAGDLVRIMEMAAEKQNRRWVMHRLPEGEEVLKKFINGIHKVGGFKILAPQKIGLGDLCILIEAADFRQRTGKMVEVDIWTLDVGLKTAWQAHTF